MPEISMKNMLSSGVHFGHQTQRWNPKMKQYIYGPRNGIYIIDLEKTVFHTKRACQAIKSVVAEGGKVLFVATKKQAKDVVKEAASRAGMPFVTERWLGGTLTNFSTIRRGVEKLIELETWKSDGTYDMLPKKEVVALERKRKKLDSTLGGVRDMKGLPDALFIIDPEMERNAVREANRLGIPLVAVVDTNCNPDPIDFVIPGNDDAIKSVSLFANLAADACLEGSEVFEQRMRSGAKPTTASAGTAAPTPETPAPVVERVSRTKSLKIPTEFDPHADDDDEEEIALPQSAEGTPEKEQEGTAKAEGADAAQDASEKKEESDSESPQDKPEDKTDS